MPKGGSSTTQVQLDPQTQAYVQQMRRAALGYAGIDKAAPGGPGSPSIVPGGNSLFGQVQQRAGVGAAEPLSPLASNLPPEIANAQQQYGNYAQAGNLGLGSLTGQNQAFMNPYLQQMNPFFQQQRQQAVEGANQQATLAGAFGGDRSQLGAATAGNLADQTQAGFNYQGFNDAQQRALAAANLGFGAIGAQAFLPQMYAQGQLGLLNSAIGPYGQTQTQTQQTDPLSQLLGLGITAGGLFMGGPVGAAAGNQAGRQLFGGGGYK